MVAVWSRVAVTVLSTYWSSSGSNEWYQSSQSLKIIYALVQMGIASTSPRPRCFTMDDLTLFAWEGFSSGGDIFKDDFCEKPIETSPMSDRVNARQLHDSPINGQDRAHHQPMDIFNRIKKVEEVTMQGQLWPEKKRGRMCENNSSADTKDSGAEGGRKTSGTRTEIPLKPVVRKSVPLQPMEAHRGAELMLEKFMEDYLLWEGTDAGAGEKYEEEEAVKTMLVN
ncbi:hypothetical protein WISP_122620 [Willisornis vidua]|uniref:Uncharacterized protein n=1 Tax=Willisornis vidua TaxID=1566151 RepID=A0ABQ9CWP1_9PASS|nr:hypothetical protein WISP_122620 [Willisornis vidua]